MNGSLRNKKLMLLALLSLNLLGWVSPSMAAINCGDTIGPNESVVLTTDLQCSDSPALILQGPNARLDMDNHEVSCTSTNNNGIVLRGRGARLMNGTVTSCKDGVQVRGRGGHTITNMVAISNADDGFDMGALRGSSNNSLVNIVATDNGDNGIEVNDGSNGNQFTNIVASNNGISITGDNNQFTNTTVSGNSVNGIEVVLGGESNLLVDSAVNGIGIVLGGESNLLVNSTVNGIGIVFGGESNLLSQ
jgi:Right handed beta helix region